MALGLAAGAGDYVWKNLNDLNKIVSDPFAFCKSIVDTIQVIFDTPNDVIYEHMGKAMGIQFAKNMDYLATTSNSVSFLFHLGRVLGPLVMEELLALFFEAYVIVPIVSRLRISLRLMLNAAPGPVDDMIQTLRLSNFEADVKINLTDSKPLDELPDTMFNDLDRDMNGWDADNPDFDTLYADANHTSGPETSTQSTAGLTDDQVLTMRVQEASIQIETQLNPNRIDAAKQILDAL